MGELISSTKPDISFVTKEITLSMQTGQYTLTAAWADVGNGFEVTIPKTGRYRIRCQFTAYTDFTTNSECGVIFQLAKNGTQIPGTYGRMHRYTTAAQTEHGQLCSVEAPIQSFTAGDVIRLRAYKNNTDPSYILYGNTFLGWSDGFLQAEMVDAYCPVQPSMTAWATFAMTIGAVTTPPTKGTTTYDQAAWRRVGANMEIRYDYLQSVAGSAGSGIYLFPIPGGEVIDTTKVPTCLGTSNYGVGAVGSGNCYNGTGHYPAGAFVYDNTNICVRYGSTSSLVSSAAMSLNSAANLAISFLASVPITGWS